MKASVCIQSIPVDESITSNAAYPVAMMIDQMRGSSRDSRIHALEGVCTIARVIGAKRVFEELVPYMLECCDDDESVLALASRQIGVLLHEFGGNKDAIQVLPHLEELLILDEGNVRANTIRSIGIAVQQLDRGEIESHVVPLVSRLCKSEWFAQQTCAVDLLAHELEDAEPRAIDKSPKGGLAKVDRASMKAERASMKADRASTGPVCGPYLWCRLDASFVAETLTQLARAETPMVRSAVCNSLSKFTQLLAASSFSSQGSQFTGGSAESRVGHEMSEEKVSGDRLVYQLIDFLARDSVHGVRCAAGRAAVALDRWEVVATLIQDPTDRVKCEVMAALKSNCDQKLKGITQERDGSKGDSLTSESRVSTDQSVRSLGLAVLQGLESAFGSKIRNPDQAQTQVGPAIGSGLGSGLGSSSAAFKTEAVRAAAAFSLLRIYGSSSGARVSRDVSEALERVFSQSSDQATGEVQLDEGVASACLSVFEDSWRKVDAEPKDERGSSSKSVGSNSKTAGSISSVGSIASVGPYVSILRHFLSQGASEGSVFSTAARTRAFVLLAKALDQQAQAEGPGSQPSGQTFQPISQTFQQSGQTFQQDDQALKDSLIDKDSILNDLTNFLLSVFGPVSLERSAVSVEAPRVDPSDPKSTGPLEGIPSTKGTTTSVSTLAWRSRQSVLCVYGHLESLRVNRDVLLHILESGLKDSAHAVRAQAATAALARSVGSNPDPQIQAVVRMAATSKNFATRTSVAKSILDALNSTTRTAFSRDGFISDLVETLRNDSVPVIRALAEAAEQVVQQRG